MKGLRIKMLDNGTADIYIDGVITDDRDKLMFNLWGLDTDGYIFPSDIKQQMEDIKGKPLNVYINSDGGNVSAGLAIANMLARHDAPVTGYVDGWAASVAGVIFLSCQKRIMPSNTFLMLHRPSCEAHGNVDDLLKVCDVLEQVHNGMLATYKKCLRNEADFEAVKQNCIDEKWYTAQEASEMFDIDLQEEQYKICACAGTDVYARFPNAPKELQDMSYYKPKTEDSETLKNKIYVQQVLSRTI